MTCQGCSIISKSKSGNKIKKKKAKPLVYSETDRKRIKTVKKTEMENWTHAEWTSWWVGGLPFILISPSCSLNVSQRAGLISFSCCTPTLFGGFARRYSVQSHFSRSLKKKKDNLLCAGDLTNGIYTETWKYFFILKTYFTAGKMVFSESWAVHAIERQILLKLVLHDHRKRKKVLSCFILLIKSSISRERCAVLDQ